jgi:hypothetical protein
MFVLGNALSFPIIRSRDLNINGFMYCLKNEHLLDVIDFALCYFLWDPVFYRVE